MLFKKLSASLLVASMAITSLVGCSSPTPSSPASPPPDPPKESSTPAPVPQKEEQNTQKDPVELTIWVTSREQDDFSKQQEDKFLKEHPHITLNKVVKEGDPGNELYQAVAAGNAPDFIAVSFTMMDKYIKAGIVEPLNTYMDNWEEAPAFTQSYLDMFTVDGSLYGLPTAVMPMYFGYNKAMFNEAGLTEPPKTWDQTIEYAKKLTNKDTQTYGFGTLAAEWTEWFFQYFVWQAGGDLTIQNPDNTLTLTFTDPAVLEAAKFYQTLRREGIMQSDLTLKHSDLVEQFAQGKLAMMPFASDWVSWAISLGARPEDIGLALFPAGPSGEQTTAIAGSCYVINAKTDQAKKDAAWEYISYLASKEQTIADYENKAYKGAINPIIIPRDDVNITAISELPEEYAAVLEATKNVGRLEFYGKASVGIYVDRAVQKILTDPNADPETEFANAQALAQKEVVDDFNNEVLK